MLRPITQEEFQKLPLEEQRKRWEELINYMPDDELMLIYQRLFPPTYSEAVVQLFLESGEQWFRQRYGKSVQEVYGLPPDKKGH